MVVLPLFWHFANKCDQTKDILLNGWTPVLAAMTISSTGGKILNSAIVMYPDIAVYQPVINGVAGNLVAVQASRISTSLHQKFQLGQMDQDQMPSLASLQNSFNSQASGIITA